MQRFAHHVTSRRQQRVFLLRQLHDEILLQAPAACNPMQHGMIKWISLGACALCSFDILQDGLGGPRSTFPHTITLVAGTQAANPRQNSLALMKLSNLGQGKHGDKVRLSNFPFLQGRALLSLQSGTVCALDLTQL